MMKKLPFLVLFSVLILLGSCCENTEKVSKEASEALSNRNFRGALKALLDLSDKTLESNDSLFLMLSEAYYGLNPSSTNIDADGICDMDITPDGKWILFTDLRNGKVLEYSFPDLRFNRAIETISPVYGIDLSSDGSTFAAALSNSNIDLFDFESGSRIKSLVGHTNRARTVAFLDSTHLISGGNDQYIITWDIPQGKVLDHQWRHRKNVKSIKRSSDGKYVLSTSNDGTAIVWDFTDKSHGKEFHKFVHGRNYVNDGAISPDSKYLVTVSGDGDAKLWDVELGIEEKRILLDEAGCSVEFSPDGKSIIVGGSGYVHIINVERGIVEEKIPISNDPVWSVKFIDNNKVAFVDSSHFYTYNLLTRKELIEASREWLKEHNG